MSNPLKSPVFNEGYKAGVMGPNPEDEGNPARRKLPTRDTTEEVYPNWLRWHKCPPKEPGWYWVVALKMWPKIVEFRYFGAHLCPVNTNDIVIQMVWDRCAGPIPDPQAPIFAIGKPGRLCNIERRSP